MKFYFLDITYLFYNLFTDCSTDLVRINILCSNFWLHFRLFCFKLFLIKISRHSKKFHWGNENHRLKGLWKRHYHVIDFRRSNSVWRNGDTFIDKGWKSFVCLKHKRKHDMHHVTHVDSSWDYFPTEWFVDTWKWVIFMSHINISCPT